MARRLVGRVLPAKGFKRLEKPLNLRSGKSDPLVLNLELEERRALIYVEDLHSDSYGALLGVFCSV